MKLDPEAKEPLYEIADLTTPGEQVVVALVVMAAAVTCYLPQ